MEETTRKKNKPNKPKSMISTILIILGVFIILIPVIGKIRANIRQEEMFKEFYLEQENNEIDEEVNDQLEDVFSWGGSSENQEEIMQNIENIEEGQLKEAKIKKMPRAIGIIHIDKIDVKLPIAEGVDMETLKFTVGHMPKTGVLGEIGNSVLAGHRSHSFGAFFNRLDEVNVGDPIVIEKGDGTKVNYKVYEKVLVDPKDTSVLNGSSKHKILTLITCHPEINPDSRLIIHAIAD